MSFTALAWASKQKTGNGTTKLILLCLANYADDKNLCFPSFKTICSISECSRATVIRTLKKLEEKGFITINKRFQEMQDSARQTSNIYELNMVSQIDTPQYQIETPEYIKETPPSIREIPHITYNNKPINKPIYSNEFETFWTMYPRRPNDNKYGAFQKFVDIIKKKEITYDELYEKTIWFRKSQDGKDTKFIPHCKTWLTQKRFLDVEKPSIKKTNLNMLVG
tara:strand:- start:528 stop:1196 length:669 start_codon:yes stop_codon:yes gene_type:complete